MGAPATKSAALFEITMISCVFSLDVGKMHKSANYLQLKRRVWAII